MPLGPGAPKWKDITDVLGSAMGYIEPVAEALSYPLEAMGMAGPQARQLFVGDQPTTPVAPAMESFGIDPSTAQSVAETAEMFLPQTGIVGPALRIAADAKALRPVAKAKLREATGPLSRRLRKDAPSGAQARKTTAEFMANPQAEYAMLEELEGGVGLYSNPDIMAWRKRQRPDLVKQLPEEMIEVRATAPRRTSTHELGHAMWERQGAAQKAAWKEAVDSGQVPSHPMMEHSYYKKNFEPGSKMLKELRDNGQYAEAAQREAAWYDENFNHWFADALEGEVKLPKGGTRLFGAEDLPAANYLQEYIQTAKPRTQAVSSPLAGAPAHMTDPLLKAMGQ